MPPKINLAKLGARAKAAKAGGKKSASIPPAVLNGGAAIAALIAVVYGAMWLLAYQQAQAVLGSPNRCDACKAVAGTAISTMRTMYQAQIDQGKKPRRIRLSPKDVTAEMCTPEYVDTFLKPTGKWPTIFDFPFTVAGEQPGTGFAAEVATACSFYLGADEEKRFQGKTVGEMIFQELGYSRKQNMEAEMLSSTCFKTEICTPAEVTAYEAGREQRFDLMQKSEAWAQQMQAEWDAKKKEAKQAAEEEAAARAMTADEEEADADANSDAEL